MIAPISSVNPGANYILLSRLNDIHLRSLDAARDPFSIRGSRTSSSAFRSLRSLNFTSTNFSGPPGRVIATGRENDVRVQGGFFKLQFDGKERFSTSVSLDIDKRGRVFDRSTGARLQKLEGNETSTFRIKRGDRTLQNGPSTGISFSGNLSSGLSIGESTSQDIELFDAEGDIIELDAGFTATDDNEFTLSLTDPTSGDSVFEGTLTFNEDGTVESLTPADGDNESNITIPTDNNPLEIAVDELDFSDFILSENTISLEAQQTSGVVEGTLDTLSINQSGELFGTFSNGGTRSFGEVAFARFANPSELGAGIGRLFEATTESGRPKIQSLSDNDFPLLTGFLDVESPESGRQRIADLLLRNQYNSPFFNSGFNNPFNTIQFAFQPQGQLFDRFS